MIRVSTTHLESYRRVLETEYGSEAELVASIKGKPFEPNWKMDAGTCWHDVLADRSIDLTGVEARTDIDRLKEAAQLRNAIRYNPPQGEMALLSLEQELDSLDDEFDLIGEGEFRFSANAVALARRHVGPGVYEVKATRVFHVGGRAVNVVAQADHARGLRLRDFKTKFGTPDARDYEGSLQWRFYLAVHQAEVFTYDLFDFREPAGGYCQLKDILSFRFWPYAGMLDECRHWLGSFVGWADARGLLPYLDRQGSTPEAA